MASTTISSALAPIDALRSHVLSGIMNFLEHFRVLIVDALRADVLGR